MPAKKTATRKPSAKKATAKKATAKKATAKKATGEATATKATAKKAGARKPSSQQGTTRARRGDLIVIDSPQVGSPPREGEVLRVIHGDVSVSYRVKWTDGHETLISPSAGTVTIVRT